MKHAILAIILILFAAVSGWATVYYVAPGGAGDGSSWATPMGTIDNIVLALNGVVAGDEIWVQTGTYSPLGGLQTSTIQLIAGVEYYGGFAGGEGQRSDRDIKGNVTALSGDFLNTPGDNTDDSFRVITGADGAILDGFTVTRGSGGATGGGFYQAGGVLSVWNCTFTDNSADTGGAIYSNGPDTSIINCSFVNNNAVNFAGALFAGNTTGGHSIIGCEFINNSAGSQMGAVFMTGDNCLVEDTVFDTNSTAASSGGAMAMNTFFGGQLRNCVFVDNSSGVNGGAIWVFSNPGFQIINCTFANNSAVGDGGAILHETGIGNMEIKNSIFWGNTAATNPQISAVTATSAANTCIEGSGGSGSAWWGGANITDNLGNIDADPDFTDDTDPDGADDVWMTIDDGLALKGRGPCLDTGLTDGDTPSTDIRGLLRPYQLEVDMGAYERWEKLIYVDRSRPGGDGSSWVQAMRRLEPALDLGEIEVGTDLYDNVVIVVARGVYYPTEDISGDPNPADPRDKTFRLRDSILLIGGLAGDEDLDMDPADRNFVLNETVLSGDIGLPGDASDNVRRVVTGALNVMINGFTIEGGNEDTWNSGAGLFTNDAMAIGNCIFQFNQANFDGAGLYVELPAGEAIVVDSCVFANNTITDTGAYGAGMCFYNNTGIAIIRNSVFTGNTGAELGGGLYSENDTALIVNCTFAGNRADDGGGSGTGGGLHVDFATTVTLQNCIVWGNTALISDPEMIGSVATVVSSDIQGCNGSGIPWAGGNFGTDGTGNIDNDPAFIDPTLPEGPDGIFASADDGLRLWGGSLLAPPSPIDSGTPGGLVPTEDILLQTRGAAVDMGAYEGPVRRTVFVDVNVGALSALDGTSWDDAYDDLGDAILLSGSWVEFWIAAGTYFPVYDTGGGIPGFVKDATFQLTSDTALYGGFAGGEIVRDARNPKIYETILDGDVGIVDDDTDNCSNIVFLADNTVIDGFTITDGYSDNTGSGPPIGAGIYGSGVADIVIRDCVFPKGYSEAGSGIGLNSVDIAAIEGCVFDSLVAESLTGGGFGGAIYIVGGGDIIVRNCVFTNNSAENEGGALYVSNLNGALEDIIIKDCIFHANTCDPQGSGGNGNGGAITISSNNNNSSIINCVIAQNESSDAFGGGLYFNGNTSISLNHCTIFDNTALMGGIGQGGGIYNDSTAVNLVNSIVWDNTADTFHEIANAGGGTTAIQNSCIQDSFQGIGVWDINLGANIAGNFEDDPLFFNSASPQGADGVFRTADDGLSLTLASPCMEAAEPGFPVKKDILGADRPRVGVFAVDPATIGAYEYPGALPKEGGEGSFFGTDAGCSMSNRSGSLGLLGVLVLAGVLLLGKRRMKYTMLIGLVMLFMFTGAAVVEAQDDDDAPLLFEDFEDLEDVEKEAKDKIEDVKKPPIVKPVRPPRPTTRTRARSLAPEIAEIKAGVSFGLDLSIFSPMGTKEDSYSSAMGFGFVVDYGMDMALIQGSLSIFSPQNQDSEEMTDSVVMISCSYIMQFGNLFAGGGGGFARDSYDGDVESGATSVMLLEGVAWYAIGNNNRIKGKLLIPVGSDNVGGILSVGYEYVF